MADATPIKFSATDRSAGERPKCRVIVSAAHSPEPALFEWELTAESWTDQHPHTEYNYVIEGHLFVQAGGVIVEAHPGDVVLVPAGATGRYWAPKYARLIAVYGPRNGEPSRRLGYQKLTS